MGHGVVHFEIPAEDPAKLRGFYSDLFDWKFEEFPGMPDYLSIHTAPEGEGIGGGMMKKQSPQHKPTNYISVESVADYLAKVTGLGGQVMMPKTAVPKMGWFAVCLDPEGNPFGLWETDEKAA
jgi:predicted enzyme related to lactoylglutathione lyase